MPLRDQSDAWSVNRTANQPRRVHLSDAVQRLLNQFPSMSNDEGACCWVSVQRFHDEVQECLRLPCAGCCDEQRLPVSGGPFSANGGDC